MVLLAKFGWRRVAIEEDVGTRWAEGRAGTARLTMGCSRAGGGRMPSKGEGESGGELGMSIADRRRTGDTDGDITLAMLCRHLMSLTLLGRPPLLATSRSPLGLTGLTRHRLQHECQV